MAEVQTHTEAGEMTQIFVEFVMMQAQNAALCLGQIADPRVGEAQVNIPLAKMFIDQLAVIRAKTAGNLTADEQRVIDNTLEQLRLAFVQVAGQTGGLDSAEMEIPGSDVPEPSAAAPKPAAVAPPEPARESQTEEGRKRFTKSYGP